MLYQKKRFSVPASSERKDCKEHWWDRRGYCVFCGVRCEGFHATVLDALSELARPDWDNPPEII